MKIWFTSDWHLGHAKVITFENDYRARVLNTWTIEDHDAHIREAILSQVGKRDILYAMGDNGNGQATYNLLRECMAAQIRYLPGNHDKDKDIALAASLERVKVWPPATYKSHWLSHHPIHPRELWGRKNIHGHVHSNSLPDENYVNVSVEAAGPKILVDFEDIKSGEYTTHGK